MCPARWPPSPFCCQNSPSSSAKIVSKMFIYKDYFPPYKVDIWHLWHDTQREITLLLDLCTFTHNQMQISAMCGWWFHLFIFLSGRWFVKNLLFYWVKATATIAGSQNETAGNKKDYFENHVFEDKTEFTRRSQINENEKKRSKEKQDLDKCSKEKQDCQIKFSVMGDTAPRNYWSK